MSWQQIADLKAADGLRGLDGKMPTQSTVRALFHKEKYAQGGKRKKRRCSKPAPVAVKARAALPWPAPQTVEPVVVPEGGPARWLANSNN